MFTTLDDIPNKKSFERGLASPLTLRTFRAECGTHNPVQAPEQYIVWVTDSHSFCESELASATNIVELKQAL